MKSDGQVSSCCKLIQVSADIDKSVLNIKVYSIVFI